jgi:RNA-binding protein
MPAAASPRKRSLMPSTALRRRLRGAGHELDAIVQIGKEGATEPVCRQIHDALDHHELVKVRVGSESPEDRFAVAERLAAEPGVQVAQILGRTLLLYKRNPEIARFG